MFGNSVLDAMATFGYLAAALGLGVCVIAYFAVPKLIKVAFGQGEEDENSED